MTTVLDLHEWEECTPGTTPALARQSFDGVPASRNLAERLAQKDILQVTELHSGLAVAATSYVGRISLGPLQITVRPKIDVDILRTLLRYAYGLRNLTTFADANQALQAGTFQDLLIVQLAVEVAELEARGLHRSYVPQEEMLAAPRGASICSGWHSKAALSLPPCRAGTTLALRTRHPTRSCLRGCGWQHGSPTTCCCAPVCAAWPHAWPSMFRSSH